MSFPTSVWLLPDAIPVRLGPSERSGSPFLASSCPGLWSCHFFTLVLWTQQTTSTRAKPWGLNIACWSRMLVHTGQVLLLHTSSKPQLRLFFCISATPCLKHHLPPSSQSLHLPRKALLSTVIRLAQLSSLSSIFSSLPQT